MSHYANMLRGFALVGVTLAAATIAGCALVARVHFPRTEGVSA